MPMRLAAFGGDMRMNGVVLAARRAGWEAVWIRGEEDVTQLADGRFDVALLPWPVSFREGALVSAPPGEGMGEDRVRALVPPCDLLVHGAGLAPRDFPRAGAGFNPGGDELFLRKNARLTAEGAVFSAMRPGQRALLGSTCLVTGYGRIGQELVSRLCAMGAFVIVCARSEEQMRAAHAAGAHPIPLAEIERAAGQADLLFNTVPARVFGGEALSRIRRDALLLELASAPYGADIEEAVRLGVNMRVESGVPGRYAPNEAGEALFEAAQRRLAEVRTARKGETEG